MGAGTRTGRLSGYRYEAHLARGPVSYGLDPRSLYKGWGRVVRLVLYRPVPGTTLWVRAAVYHRGWLRGRKAHLELVRRVVELLER